jgi:hypothetical protein
MGRRKLYETEEEKKQAQRANALKYYYRKKALNAALAEHPHSDEEIVRVTVNDTSKRMGTISEEIEYKVRPDGRLLKKHSK